MVYISFDIAKLVICLRISKHFALKNVSVRKKVAFLTFQGKKTPISTVRNGKSMLSECEIWMYRINLLPLH